MQSRPLLASFARTPWVANEPLDHERVADVLPRQVQVAFRPDARGSLQPVPLTPAAHDLLYGPSRDRAQRFFTGVIDAAHAVGAGDALRGMSLSDSDAGFATNAMASMIEAGYVPNSVQSGDRTRFLRDFQGIADATRGARAQNTGWMDIGPAVSAHALRLIRSGPQAVSRDDATELGLVLTHELQHTVTPPGPAIHDHHVWLEEGTAEALTWWPGATRSTMQAIGAPVPAHDPDPYTVPPKLLPSTEYRMHHRRVVELLGLAGVSPYTATEEVNPAGLASARRLLQSSHVSGVPRDLARAIAHHQGIDSRHVPEITQRISALGANGRDAQSVLDGFHVAQPSP